MRMQMPDTQPFCIIRHTFGLGEEPRDRSRALPGEEGSIARFVQKVRRLYPRQQRHLSLEFGQACMPWFFGRGKQRPDMRGEPLPFKRQQFVQDEGF